MHSTPGDLREEEVEEVEGEDSGVVEDLEVEELDEEADNREEQDVGLVVEEDTADVVDIKEVVEG